MIAMQERYLIVLKAIIGKVLKKQLN